MSLISQKLQAVHESIRCATALALRAQETVTLLAVSKTFDANAVLESISSGQYAFGENYLQEALEKISAVGVATRAAGSTHAIVWHFIGPIQSNKTRLIAENFDWVHTVEREKIAQRLSDQRPSTLAPLNVCLQINISREASKSGVFPEEALAVAHAIAALPRLKLRGLMAIPAPDEDPVRQRAAFRQVRELFMQLEESGLVLDTLSMGMSGDMTAAIAEGATIVRVGSAIFGSRDYS